MTGHSIDDLVSRIAQASGANRSMSTRIIAIDGPGGSGKSTLAERLAQALNGAPVVHTDDFASWDHPIDWWPRLLAQVLEPLAENRTARYQRYDWDTQSLAEWHVIAPTEFVVLEGVSASREAFRRFLTFSIWVETPRDERLRRGLERDGVDAQQQWVSWMAAEDEYIERERPAQRADVVIDGTAPLT